MFSFAATEEFRFEAEGAGVNDGESQSLRSKLTDGLKDTHLGTRMRLTSHRLLWYAAAVDGWLTLHLDSVAHAECKQGLMRSRRCVVRLSSGVEVSVKCGEDSRADELLGKLLGAVNAAGWRAGSYDVASTGGIGKLLARKENQQRNVEETFDVALTDLTALKQHAAQTVAAARQLPTQRPEGGADAGVQQLLEDFGLLSGPGGKPVATGGPDVESDVLRVCTAALEKRGGLGMLLAHDAFCLVNRARGTALVSPEEVMAALKRCSRPGQQLRLRAIGSTGAFAVSLAKTSEAEADAQLLQLTQTGPLDAFRLAAELGLSAAESQYLLRDAEARASLVRDDAPEGVFYYKNFFSDL